MGLAFVITRVTGALRRLLGSQPHAPAHARQRMPLHTAAGRGQVAWNGQPVAPGKPLRVVRVVDAGHAPSTAGRMLISGRMADVCAELDRLAALEAAAA